MNGLTALAYALSASAVLAAAQSSRRRAEVWPLAVFLTGSLAADLARRAIRIWTIAPARAAFVASGGDPVASAIPGIELAAVVDSALFLAGPAGLAALAFAVFFRRRPWPILAVWCAAVVALALAYPEPRYGALRGVYLAAELGALCVGAGSIATWTAKKLPPNAEHATTVVLVGIELASIFVGPWARTSVFTEWHLAVIMYCCGYVTLLALLGGFYVRGDSRGPVD